MCLGIPGKLVEKYVRDDLPMGKVDFGDVRKEVCLAYTPDVEVGKYVLVHVGFALSVIDEEEAEQMRSLVEQIEAAADASAVPPSSMVGRSATQTDKRPD